MKTPKISLSLIFILLAFLLLIAACRQEEPTPTAESLPTGPQATAVLQTSTQTPTPLVEVEKTATLTPVPSKTPQEATPISAAVITPTLTPTAEPTFTPLPTLPPTPEATLPPLPNPTPWPLAENAISPDNVEQLVQSGRIGWGEVDRLRYSPDGNTLAIATNLGIFLHDAQSGERLQTTDIPSPLVSFNFSPDGTLMASGHNDRRIRIWQVSDGSLVRTIENETAGAVWSVAFSPDGEQIASAITNENGLIYIWRVSDGTLIRTLSGHQSRVRDVVFSPDGRFLASASIDWEVRLWNASDGTEHARLRGHDGPVWRVTFTPDSQTLISAGSKGEAGIWRVSDGARIDIIIAQQPFIEVVALAVSPDNERFYTAAEDGFLRAWDVADQGQLFEIDFDLIVQELTLSPDGQTLAVLLGNSNVQLFDAETGQPVEPILPYSIFGGTSVAFSPDGTNLLIASFWDLKRWPTNAETVTITPLSDGSFNNLQTVVYDPNGRYFATGSNSEAFWLWDASNEGLVGYFPADSPSNQVIALATSGNGQRLAVGWSDTLVSIAQIPDNLLAQIIFNIETAGRVSTVALSNDGTQIYVANPDGSIERWELPETDDTTGIVSLTPLSGHLAQVTELALSPDGSILVSVDIEGQVKLWQVDDGTLVAEINESENYISAVTFSPDGQLFATAGVDQVVRIYQTDNQQFLRTLAGPQSLIQSLAFSPDGSTLAAGTQGAAAFLWTLPQ